MLVPKQIRHSAGTKKEFGEWVHPDIIGISYPTWSNEVSKLSQIFGDTVVKIYSIEIKRSLSFGNLRDAFFQAVSNSSWAHEGYLAAADISTDEDFREELRRLSTSFGIGIIELDLEDPDASDVLVPARGRFSVDWEALSKLARMNADTAHLLSQINNALQIKDFRYGDFDLSERPVPLVIRQTKNNN